jgi:fructokinase
MTEREAQQLVRQYLAPPDPAPVVAGSGLIALDVIINDQAPNEPRLQTGGSCGNVLSILSYLGWESFPLARINQSPASAKVREDLARWGVRLDYDCLGTGVETPVVVHQISHNSAGEAFHRFAWHCPGCGSWFSSYQPLTLAVAKELLQEIRVPAVFFFDRVSRSNLLLAKSFRENGCLVFFEPTGVSDPGLFCEALELAHILKYSHERMRKVREIHDVQKVWLEIETQGKEGLRYRSRLENWNNRAWHKVESFNVPEVKDTAGAGDWCTAVLIHCVGRQGSAPLLQLRQEEFQQVLQLAQAVSAWNCGFEGARGGMYEVSRESMAIQVARILTGKSLQIEPPPEFSPEVLRLLREICPSCQDAKNNPHLLSSEITGQKCRHGRYVSD